MPWCGPDIIWIGVSLTVIYFSVRAPSVESIPYYGSNEDFTTSKHTRSKNHQKRSKSLDKRFNRYVDDDSNEHINFKDLLKAINRVSHSHADKNVSPKKVKLARKQQESLARDPIRPRSFLGGSVTSSGFSDRSDRSSDSPGMINFSNIVLKSTYHVDPRASRASAPIAPHYNESLDTLSSYGDDFQNELNNYQESLKHIEHLANSQTYPYITASPAISRNSTAASSSLSTFNEFNVSQAVIEASNPVLITSNTKSPSSNIESKTNVINSSKSSPVKTLKASTSRLFKPNSFLGGSFMSLQAYPRGTTKDAASKQRSNLSLNIQHLNSETISNALLNSVQQSSFPMNSGQTISLIKCDAQSKCASISSLASNKYPSLKSFLEIDENVDLRLSKTFSEIAEEENLINFRDTPQKQSFFGSIDRKLLGGSSELSVGKYYQPPCVHKFKMPPNALASSAQTLSCLSSRDIKRELRNRQSRESIIHRNALSISSLSPGVLNRTHPMNPEDSTISSVCESKSSLIGTVIGNPYSVDSSLSCINTQAEINSIQKLAPLAGECDDVSVSNLKLEPGYLGSVSTLKNLEDEESEILTDHNHHLAITTWETLEKRSSNDMIFQNIDSEATAAQNSQLQLARANPSPVAFSQADLMKFETPSTDDLLGEIPAEMDPGAIIEAINSRNMEEMMCKKETCDNLSLMMPYIDDEREEYSSTLCESELKTDTISDSCSIQMCSERSDDKHSDESSQVVQNSSSSWHLFSKSVSVQLSCVPGMDYLQALDSPTLAFMAYYSFLPVLHDTCVSLTIVPKKIRLDPFLKSY